MKYRHKKTGIIYTVLENPAINCNDDIQLIDKNREEIIYFNDGIMFVQEKGAFLSKFEVVGIEQ